jgi:hypothetical protein
VTPLPPIGNPNLKGIVAGQQYDPATPYIWTQVSTAALAYQNKRFILHVLTIGLSIITTENA